MFGFNKQSKDKKKFDALCTVLTHLILMQVGLLGQFWRQGFLNAPENESIKWKAFGYIYGLADCAFQISQIENEKLHKELMFFVFAVALSPDKKIFHHLEDICSPEAANKVAIEVNQRMIAGDTNVTKGINAGAEEYRRFVLGERSNGMIGLLELFRSLRA